MSLNSMSFKRLAGVSSVDLNRDMKLVNKIIVHCSDTDKEEHDNIEWLRELHLAKGWSDIGYHFFIDKKGHIFDGRPITKSGAHCTGQNLRSIGVCLSGRKNFYETQFRQAHFLITGLMKSYKIERANVQPHNYFTPLKTCPNFSLEKIWVFDA